MPPKAVVGLEDALVTAGLEVHIAAAAAWCERMGARDLDEIGEDEVFEEFAKELQLKPLERRRLRKALPAAPAGGQPGGTGQPLPQGPPIGAAASSGAEAAQPSFPSGGPGPPAGALPSSPSRFGPTVFVKNTFLDLDFGPRPDNLRRLHTEPAQAADAELLDLLDRSGATEATSTVDEDEEYDESADAGVEDEVPPDGAARNAASGMYRTVTYDGYEPVGEWTWAGGDPNKPPPVPEDHATWQEQEAPSAVSSHEVHQVWGAAPEQTGPHMVGMVMVPAEAFAGYAVPMHSAAGMHFPGCVAIPMDRFARWPGDQGGDAHAGGVPADGSADPSHAPGAATGAAERAPGGALPSAAAAAADDEGAGPRRAQVLQRAFSVASSIYRIRWTVNARILVSTDREHVSPSFDLCFQKPVQFKMVIRPKVMSDEKGGQCFKKARGRGKILLRCLDNVEQSARPVVSFRLAVGSPTKQAAPRGPVRHDFSEHPIVGLPEHQQQWDFTKAVCKATHTFVVCLEVLLGAT